MIGYVVGAFHADVSALDGAGCMLVSADPRPVHLVSRDLDHQWFGRDHAGDGIGVDPSGFFESGSSSAACGDRCPLAICGDALSGCCIGDAPEAAGPFGGGGYWLAFAISSRIIS